MIVESKNGVAVFVPMKHMKAHKSDLPLIAQAIRRIELHRTNLIKTTVLFDRAIGRSACVKTTDHDHIVYAKRVGRLHKTRFVLNRQPEDTNAVSLILRGCGDAYRLLTGYVGDLAPREPHDHSICSVRDMDEAIEFWQSHALVWDPTIIEN